MPRGRNDYETAQIQGRLWTPAVLRPALWVDAADISTISVATGISEWRDKSGNNRHFSQTTTSLQPTLQPENLNGLATILFDGQKYVANSVASLSVTSETSITLLKRSASATTFSRFFTKANTANDVTYVTILYGDGAATGQIGSYIGGMRSVITVNADVWEIFSCTHTGAELTNRTPQVAGAAYAHTLSTNYDRFAIAYDFFALGNGGELNGGSVAETIYFTSALSSRDRNACEGYLAWKWGVVNRLPADHPFANRPPLIGD